MRRIRTYVGHAGGFGRGALILALALLTGGLQGCASWKPEGAHGLDDTIADSDLRALPQTQARVLVLVDPGAVGQTIDRPADGVFGGSCEVSFTLYPELYLQTYGKLAAIFSRVDIAESTPAVDYDLIVSPRIDDVRWNAGGLSANLAAVAAHFQLRGQSGLQDVHAYQMAKGELGRVHNGCGDATISAARGARAAVELVVNRLVLELSRQGAVRAASAGKAPALDQARTAALLARLEAGRGQAGSLRSEQNYAPMIAAGLDVAGATFDLHGQAASAQTARQLAQGLRSNAAAASGAGMGSAGGGALPSSAAMPIGAIPVPPEAAEASCQGDYGFLRPYLRAYTAPQLADIRDRMLMASVSEMVAAVGAQGGGNGAALLRRQAAGSEQAAQEAAQGAQASDGQGNVSIPMAESDTLPLGFSCGNGAAVHASMVCAYIAQRWSSLFERTTADLYERCH